ncbi:MAG: YfiR family protein [Cytophagales bacterium]|nr:YfiR family protein [Cytophagales bacterium]
MKKSDKIFAIIILMMTLWYCQKSQAQDVNYKVHAMFMYHFTKYLDWPESKKTGDFVIGVYGNSDISKELESIAAAKKAGTQNIIVKKLSSASEATGCHIVFVSGSKSSDVNDLCNALSGKPTLVVTEKNGLCKKGSGINFILVDDKLRFEINKNAIESNSLKVSTELQKLGILI